MPSGAWKALLTVFVCVSVIFVSLLPFCKRWMERMRGYIWEENGLIWTDSVLLTLYCWHSVLTSNTTNISSTPSQARGNSVPQKEHTHTHTHTHLNICVSMKAPMGDTYVPTQTHMQTLVELSHLERRETNTQTHIITPTSERTGAGRQTASQILLQWSAAVSGS